MDQQQARFDGWCILELMGHQREIGYVTTEYYGPAALFRVDTPEIPEREYELKRPEYDNESGRYIPVGSKVKRVAIPAKSRLVAPGALYAMNPCTEETARKAIEEMVPRTLIVLEIKEDPRRALHAGEDGGRKPCGCDPCESCDECERDEEEIPI